MVNSNITLYTTNTSNVHDFIAADKISIADIVLFPWATLAYRLAIDFLEYPNLNAWVHRLDQIPEMQKGLDVPHYNSYRIVRSNSVKVKEELNRYKPDFYVTSKLSKVLTK